MKFNGDNYHEWEKAIMIQLRKRNAIRALKTERPEEPCTVEVKVEKKQETLPKKRLSSSDISKDASKAPDAASLTQGEIKRQWDLIDKWNDMDEIAQGIILESVHHRYDSKLSNLETAADMMKFIKEEYERNAVSSMIKARNEFHQLKCDNLENVENLLSAVDNYVQRLKGTSAEIGTVEAIIKVMNTLPEDWNSFTQTLRAQPNTLESWGNFSYIITREARFRLGSENPTTEQQTRRAMIIQKKDFTCYNCGKKGHKKIDCWAAGGGKAGKGPKQGGPKQAATAKVATDKYLFLVTDKGTYILDSGATDHMSGDPNIFKELINLETKQKITLADGSDIFADGIGSVELRKGSTTFELKDVLYVPELGNRHLISVNKLVTKGFTVEFDRFGAEIKHGRKVILTARKVSGIYELEFDHRKSAMTAEVIEKKLTKKPLHWWHRAMGHLNYRDLKKLEEVANGVKFTDLKEKGCETCIKGKATRYSFHKKDKSAKNNLSPGDVLSADLGFVEGLTYMCLTDNATGCTYTTIMKKKSDSAEELKIFLANLKTQSNITPKIIKCDGGTEFKGSFRSICEEKGIELVPSNPHTPQQNGVAERMNRTLKETARCMIIDAKISDIDQHVGDALLYATHVRNRTPIYYKGQLMTRLEAFTGIKPDLINLHPFGTRCFAVMEKSQLDNHLLLDKTSECIIVGLTRNGFVVERIEDKKRFNTCHLKFVEEEEDDNQTNSQNSEEHSKLAMITKGESSMIELEPRSYSQAMECEESAYWRAAIQAELDSLRRNGTFGPPQNLPEGKKAVTSKWVFKRKMKQDGTLDKYKARLVARGYTQRAGTDYEDVFAPVVGIKGLRILLSIATSCLMQILTIDVSSAYLYAELDKEVYLSCPEGFDSNCQGKVVKLIKGLYGLKQSGKLWYEELKGTLERILGFKQCLNEPGIYFKRANETNIFISVYVDDIIIASNKKEDINSFITGISKFYKISIGNERKLEILNMKLTYSIGKELRISQSKYIKDIVKEWKMEEAKCEDLPLPEGFIILENSEKLVEVPYLELIGKLGYLAKSSRPDIAFSYSYLARYCHRVTESAWNGAKRVLRYLKRTEEKDLTYKSEGKMTEKVISAYADAAFANNQGYCSTTGFTIFYGTHLIHWKSKKQTTPSTSTTESEIHALIDCVKEALHIKNLIEEMEGKGIKLKIYCDNKATIEVTRNHVLNGKTKHMLSKIAFIRHFLEKKDFDLEYIESKKNLADILTKAPKKEIFQKHSRLLGLGGLLEHGDNPMLLESS